MAANPQLTGVSLIINNFHLPVAIDCKQMFLLRDDTVLLLFGGAPYPEGIHSDAPALLAVLLCRGIISIFGV
jgi:hypothetical protein